MGPVTLLPQFLDPEMGLITHKSLAQLRLDHSGTRLREGSIRKIVPDPQVSQQIVGVMELLVMVMPAWKELEAPIPLPLLLSKVS